MKKELDIFQKYLQTPMRIEKRKKKRIKENLLQTIIEGFVREAPKKEKQPGETWQTTKGWVAKSMDTSITKPMYGFKDEPSAKAWATGGAPAPDDKAEPTGQPTGGAPSLGQVAKDVRTAIAAKDTEQPPVANNKAASGDEREEQPKRNLSSLKSQIQNGIVAPGNDFSMYQEAVSTHVANYILSEGEDISDQKIINQILSLDCNSKSLTSNVGANFGQTTNTQILDSFDFTKNCDGKYSDKQNLARYLTAQMAREKASRMRESIESAGLSVDNMNHDSFSGDQDSLQVMKEMISKQKKPIFTKDGQQVTREDLLEWVDGFGSTKFPADTAMISVDEKGNMVFQAFSDKKDLDAIMNNSTVDTEMKEDIEYIKQNCSDEECQKVVGQLESKREEYIVQENKLKALASLPADRVVRMCKEENQAGLKKMEQKYRERSETHFNNSITNRYVPGKAIIKRGKADDYLKKVGWDGKSPPTSTQQLCAFAVDMQERIGSNDEDLNPTIPDNKLLIGGLGEENAQKLADTLETVRTRSIELLQESREIMDQLQSPVEGVGLGTYTTALRAYKALHFDMGKYGGSLSMVAGPGVYDEEDFHRCLKTDHESQTSPEEQFAERIDITMEPTRGTRKDTPLTLGRVTGGKVEVFSVSEGNENVKVGTRSIRSKDGLLGKLQTTFNFHPDFRKCLKGKSQPQESKSPELRKLIRDIALWKLGKYGN